MRRLALVHPLSVGGTSGVRESDGRDDPLNQFETVMLVLHLYLIP